MKLLLLILLLVTMDIQSQSMAECDRLIQQGIDLMKKAEHPKSLEALTRAASMAHQRGWHKQHFLALNNIGANYYNMLDYGEALRHYLDAYTLSIQSLGPQQEMTALNNIGILYLSDREYAKAEEYMVKAFELAKKTDNRKKIAIYAVNLALVCNAQNELARARGYLETASAFIKENPYVQPEARIALADNYFRLGKFSQARAQALENLELSGPGFSKHRHETLLTLSRIAQRDKDLPGALHYATLAAQMPMDQQSKIAGHEQLAAVYASTGQYPLALAAKDSVLFYTEEFNAIRNGRVYENNRVKFELENYKNQLRRNMTDLEASRNRLYQLFGGGIFFLLIIGWAARTKHLSARQSKIILERNNELISLELKKKQSDNLLLEKQMREQETKALLEQERLRNEIESRNRKLSAKALYLIERDQLIDSLLHDLSSVRQLRNEPLIDKQIAKLKNLLRTDGDWEDFVNHFDETNHGMLAALRQKHPVLTAGDLRYISYVYMNLSHKEIAGLLNITPEACRKRKERVCRKMGLDESTALLEYLSSLG